MSIVILELVIMIVKFCLYVIIGFFIFLYYYSDFLLFRLRNILEYLIYCYEVFDLSFVCFKGFGIVIFSSVSLFGGIFIIGFGVF